MNTAPRDPAEPPVDVNVRVGGPRPRGRLILIGIAVVVVAVLAVGAVFVVQSIQRDELMRTGKQVQAVARDDLFSKRVKNDHEYYYVVWTYTVDDREYTITGRKRHFSRVTASNYMRGLDGATATVYYDPADPSRAALGDEP